MNGSMGKTIAFYRKAKGLTQEEVAEKLGVTPQAVSKWENDASCPDITLLVPLGQLLGVGVEELLSSEPVQETRFVPEEQRKSADELVLKIIIHSTDGDKVRVNLPLQLVKLCLEMGVKMPQVNKNGQFDNIDFGEILRLANSGAIGKLVEIEDSDGDTVDIVIE